MSELRRTDNPPESRLVITGLPSVSLRLLRSGDENEFYEMLSAGGPNIDKFQYWDNGFSPETIKAAVERSIGETEEGRMLRYSIVNEHAGEENMIGEVAFYDHDEATQTAHFGYLIAAEFEGQGIVSAASKELIKYASERWDLKKILMDIEIGNERSGHLAVSLGAHPTDEIKRVKGGGKMRQLRVWEIEL